MGDKRYSAFISYNHRDRRWATWLHRGIERYHIPKSLRGRESRLGTLGDRLPPVFRDRDELAASGNLAADVEAALAEAETLVVICSPAAAASRWVDAEVATFARWGRAADIRLIIVDGEPHAADPARECLPPAVRALPAEPLAADARAGQDGPADARLKIIAGILGLPFDDLRRREAQRRLRRLTALAAGATAGLLLTSALAAFAWIQRGEALRQRAVAERRTLTAERTLDFVKGMFRVSDPLSAQGQTITAREVVDRGAARLAEGLADQPAVRADLGVTLSEVYRALGLLPRAERLVRASLRVPHGDAGIRVRQLAALAETRADQGEYAEALAGFGRAEREAARAGLLTPEVHARLLVGAGQAYSALGDRAAADRAVKAALRLDLARVGPSHVDTANDWQVLGLNARYDGDLAGARPLIARALALRLAAEGPNSPAVVDSRNSLAAIAYGTGDLVTAERMFRANLRTDEAVLGPDHPDLAATLNNLARALIDRRRFAEAAPLLERAIAINAKQGRLEHEDMAFLYSNLGIARRHLSATGDAARWFDRGIAVARARGHRVLGPALADRAELACATGRREEAAPLLAEAAAATARDYPDDAWRAAWLENIRGACTRDAAAMLRSNAVIAKRWPRNTYYGGDAARRAAWVAR